MVKKLWSCFEPSVGSLIRFHLHASQAILYIEMRKALLSWNWLWQISFCVATVFAGCPDFRGDANFTKPNQENALVYQKVIQTFKKVQFNSSEFLRCGEVSMQYSNISDDQVNTQYINVSNTT
jgi:hypothetical protein